MKTILIIDDSPVVRDQICTTLATAGYETVQAVDGVEGIAKLDGDPAISLILCDINMPRMNGLQVLDELARAGRLQKVPIIMLTTEGQPSLIERAKKAGARGWIVKPFKDHLLLAAMKKLIGP